MTFAMGKRCRQDQSFAVGTSAANRREWREHPDADGFLQEAIKSNLEQAHTLLADVAPRLAMRLVELVLDPKVKAYAQISAISEAFKVMQQGVVDKEHQDWICHHRHLLCQVC